MRNALATVGHMVIAVAIAAAVSGISLSAIGRVQWPAFPSSKQLRALTTVGQVRCILGLLCAGWVWRRSRGQMVARLLALVFVSAFSVVTLGMPLGATKLYLFGISVDQQFRTEYLTRLTDSSALHDMTYAGLPAFYPPGWFLVGGRIAALSGTPGWETFKPWAITSITIAIAVALVLWSRMIRFEYALLVTTATAAVMLAYSSPEPYSAMITVLLPPVLILTWSGLRGGNRSGGWAAVIGGGAFLGVAATCYTLLTAYSAFTMGLMALVLTASRWRDGLKAALDPLLRLVVIGAIAAVIAATTGLPFLLRAAHDPVSNTGSAFHYLPADGAELTFPMLKFTLLGALCLLGTLWLVVRARSSVQAGGLAITVLLPAEGVFGFIEFTHDLAARGRDHAWGRAVLPVAASIGLAAAIAFSQDIPDVLRPDLTIAYTDTDGHGQRGDRRPPSSEKYSPEIDTAITRATGKPRDETVVLTADYSFLSYYPYFGFQGLTSHYANPLAEFDKRAAAIKSWSKLKAADPFIHALDTLPWAPPTVFLMRHGGSAGESSTYTLRLAEDVYPNQPNVRRYTVGLNAAMFADPRVYRPHDRPVRVGGPKAGAEVMEQLPSTCYLRHARCCSLVR